MVKFGYGFCEAALNIFKKINAFLSVRGPDRENVFKDRTDIGIDGKF